VKIGGIDYRVELYDEDSNDAEVGNVNFMKSRIKIVRAERQYMESTLWHEILHAILVTNGDTELSKNEGFVERTSGMIYQVLKDNPNLYKEIRESKK
jgi:hypothetical protein